MKIREAAQQETELDLTRRDPNAWLWSEGKRLLDLDRENFWRVQGDLFGSMVD